MPHGGDMLRAAFAAWIPICSKLFANGTHGGNLAAVLAAASPRAGVCPEVVPGQESGTSVGVSSALGDALGDRAVTLSFDGRGFGCGGGGGATSVPPT